MTLLEIAGFVAAALAGTGVCLLGVRAADALNRKLGRGVPSTDDPARRADERPEAD